MQDPAQSLVLIHSEAAGGQIDVNGHAINQSSHSAALTTALQAAQVAAARDTQHGTPSGIPTIQQAMQMSGTSSSKEKRVQTRRSWTPEEDKRLVELVTSDGANCWSTIAANLDGRVGKQCRERWRNHLDPNIRRDPFTQDEDERILEHVQELGTRWSKIAQRLPGRTENAVKNRYHCFLKNRDAVTAKRAREEKASPIGLSKHKRMNSDKQFMMFNGDSEGMGSPKSSPEGTFACNLLGCGKQYTTLPQFLAHRLHHYAEGRHPSAQPQTGAPMAPEQRSNEAPEQTVMLVRAIDGLVDGLLSQIQPRSGLGRQYDEHHLDSGDLKVKDVKHFPFSPPRYSDDGVQQDHGLNSTFAESAMSMAASHVMHDIGFDHHVIKGEDSLKST